MPDVLLAGTLGVLSVLVVILVLVIRRSRGNGRHRGCFQYFEFDPLAVTFSAACTPKGKVILP